MNAPEVFHGRSISQFSRPVVFMTELMWYVSLRKMTFPFLPHSWNALITDGASSDPSQAGSTTQVFNLGGPCAEMPLNRKATRQKNSSPIWDRYMMTMVLFNRHSHHIWDEIWIYICDVFYPARGKLVCKVQQHVPTHSRSRKEKLWDGYTASYVDLLVFDNSTKKENTKPDRYSSVLRRWCEKRTLRDKRSKETGILYLLLDEDQVTELGEGDLSSSHPLAISVWLTCFDSERLHCSDFPAFKKTIGSMAPWGYADYSFEELGVRVIGQSNIMGSAKSLHNTTCTISPGTTRASFQRQGDEIFKIFLRKDDDDSRTGKEYEV